MKKSLAIFLIFLSFVAGFFSNKIIAKKDRGLTKAQLEKLTNRKISNDEWEEITKGGEVEIIGGGNGATQIFTNSNK